ncbi:MAG TPA: substrate-binding domain-containing protein [Solirubrobacterales bacterium]|nr:substrate-binding domain-containing protein [Solirubrobacterales bacterium]
MFSFKQMSAKAVIRHAPLMTAVAAVMAVGGVGASSALAETACVPEGTKIVGTGTAVQKSAQEIWTGRKVESNPADPAYYEQANLPQAKGLGDGYFKQCEGKASPPSVTYGSTGSGAGLFAFRFTGAGTINKRIGFIGTTVAPTAAQIENAESATTGGKATGANPIVVPVTQTAIAVIVNLPENCVFKAGKGITSAELTQVFGGTEITEWSQFSQIEAKVGGACSNKIKRVVRTDGSGTTFHLKNYLDVVDKTAAGTPPPCETAGVASPGITWADLMPIKSPGVNPNIEWPKCAGGTEVLPTSGMVAKVEETDSSIGYAALPDAKKGGAAVEEVALQNGGPLIKIYAGPESGEGANCANAKYTVPKRGQSDSMDPTAGEGVDWSAVFWANPTVGGANYPLCTLTYMVGWSDYSKTPIENPGNTSAIVEDYIKNYVVPAGAGLGQQDLGNKWYAPLPTLGGPGSENSVQDAAEFAAGKL